MHGVSCCVRSACVSRPLPTPVVASLSTAQGGEKEGVFDYVSLLFRYVLACVTGLCSVCFLLDVLWGPQVGATRAYPVGQWLCVSMPTASCVGPHSKVGLCLYPPMPSARTEGFPTWASVNLHTPFGGGCARQGPGERGGAGYVGVPLAALPPLGILPMPLGRLGDGEEEVPGSLINGGAA